MIPYNSIALVLCLFTTLSACAPTLMERKEHKPLEVDFIEPYSVSKTLAGLPKPGKPVKLTAKKEGSSFVLCDSQEATHIIYAVVEAKKINALKDLAINYKQIILDQEKLVNSYIEQFNTINRLYALEVEKSDLYYASWRESENNYRQERYSHKVDNTINRVGIYIMVVSSLAVLVIAF